LPPGLKADRLLTAVLECTAPEAEEPVFWTFQGSSYPERPDWIFPLPRAFARENFMGMNAPDYGGGIPVVDVWCRSWGAALGSLATRPEPVALPLRVLSPRTVSIGLEDRAFRERLGDGGVYSILPAVLLAHTGDCSGALETYADLMEREGVCRPVPPPSSANLPEWCAWGYERSFLPEQIFATLPLARTLGFGWATVDDGWQTADGDWDPDPRKLPYGLKPLADSIHAAGMLARLWWVPLEAHDSTHAAATCPDRMREFGMALQSRLALEHPDWFQQNADGSRTQISWWNSYVLCPAVPEVQRYYCRLARRMVGEWGFDGLKIDGQNLNAVPPCYNPAHAHASPHDAPRAVPVFFRELSAAVRGVRRETVLQLCPCGTVFSIYNLPYATQTVASDPTSAFQVRAKGKVLHALQRTSLSYSGDHVELTNRLWDPETNRFVARGEEDFASTIGVGGVPSSKFTLAGIAQADSSMALSPAKEKVWRSWIAAYERERPGEGQYAPLYDIAFDRPETHVIVKGRVLYYAFFSPGSFTGDVRLRGLEPREYEIRRFLDDRSIARIHGSEPLLPVSFTRALLVKAVPREGKPGDRK
jgi:alpha-galactosidase